MRQVLLHGTPRPEVILSEGLLPGQENSVAGGSPDGDQYVYLSGSYAMAQTFGTVITVYIPEPDKLQPDPLSRGVRYPDPIPPENLVWPDVERNEWDREQFYDIQEYTDA